MSKILLLEPNRLLAQQYMALLQGMGHDVEWSEDAQTGITSADETVPDLIIIELLLAGHSGIEFLYEFRSYPEWRDVPAIVLTSVAPRDIKASEQILRELGVAMLLYKPDTSLTMLRHHVKRALQVAPQETR